MRAVFSLLGLVVVAAIVLLLAKNQLSALKPLAAPAASAAGGGGAADVGRPTLSTPKAVGAQVQNSLDDAARRAAEAASAAAQ